MYGISIKLVADTNIGAVRQNNEDNYTICHDLENADWDAPQTDNYIEMGVYGCLLAVADGMGGMNAGEVASAIAIETIHDMFATNLPDDIIKSDSAVIDFLYEVTENANIAILKESKKDSNSQGMGTTIVLVWAIGRKAYISWCGDSRCYVYNQAGGLTRLTKDHSYVQELIDCGELEPELASSHPHANIITRCLGETGNHAWPDTCIYDIHTDDILLLCSDGLTSMCTDKEIQNIMERHQDNLSECKDALISQALDAGGYDNVTIALGSFK